MKKMLNLTFNFKNNLFLIKLLTAIIFFSISLCDFAHSKNNTNKIQNKKKVSNIPRIKTFFEDSNAKYVYLKPTKINLRVGPSLNSPIALKIFGKGEPLQMLATFYQWVNVKTIEGVEGWVQSPTVSKTVKYGIVISTGINNYIYAHALDSKYSRKIMKIENQVRVRVLKCTNDNWCKIKVKSMQAWVEKKELWGI